MRFPSEESPDSIGRTTGEIPAGVTLGKCHREETADGPQMGTGKGETVV